MKAIVREFLTFSKTEQRGIFFLCFLILCVQTVRWVYPLFQSAEYPITINELNELNGWIAIREKDTTEDHHWKKQWEKKPAKNIQLFSFDPNTLPVKDWEKLGFSEKQSASIGKFRESGFVFRSKEDLKKLYSVDEEKYRLLQPYILLPDKIESRFVKKENVRQVKPKVELNKADTLELDGLRGIGMFRAKKISEYRQKIGGFYSIDQLLEIKGFPDSLLQLVNEQVTIDTLLIRKIRINSISAEELQKHPYFWYGLGKTVVNYRTKHGSFSKPEDLLKIYSLKPEVYKKVVHYLSFE